MSMLDIDQFQKGKRIALEIGAELNVGLAGVSMALKSILVGLEPNEYLIIKFTGNLSTIKHKLYKGNELIVKYLSHGTIYAFQTKLIEAIYKPFRLIFLEYPKIIETHDLRSNKRLNSFIPSNVKIKDSILQGALIDISKRGCRCKITINKQEKIPLVRIDDQIILNCKFPGFEGDYEILGKVRNIHKNSLEVIFGLEFHKMEYEVQNIISQYIFSVEDIALH